MINFRGQKYKKINRFDCRVLDFETEDGGGFMTVLAISPRDYRESHPTKAWVVVAEGNSVTKFHISDDWGNLHTVTISNSHTAEIAGAIRAAKREGLLKN